MLGLVKVAVYKADALVIRSREYGEADRLVTLFSRENGKLEAVAKGVRKPKSSQRAGVQLFTYADFLLHRGKTLDTVCQAQPRESFPHLWDDFDRTIGATGMVELLDISTAREQAEPELFFLTLSFLFLIKDTDPYLAMAAYTLRLLRLQGHLPALEGEKEQIGLLTAGSIAFVKQLAKTDVDKIDRLRWHVKMREEILDSLCFFCEEKFERKLKSWRQRSSFQQ